MMWAFEYKTVPSALCAGASLSSCSTCPFSRWCCVSGPGRAGAVGWWWLVLDYKRAGSSLFLCQGVHRGTQSGSRKIRCVREEECKAEDSVPSTFSVTTSVQHFPAAAGFHSLCVHLLAVRAWAVGLWKKHLVLRRRCLHQTYFWAFCYLRLLQSRSLWWAASDAHLIWPVPNWNTPTANSTHMDTALLPPGWPILV